MCGIAGALFGADSTVDGREFGRRASEALQHRGPDDDGQWVDASQGIVFAHTRLAILDVTPAGHQPMLSAAGRYVLAFNGEIYNHAELRQQLEKAEAAPPWRGHSDTETLLAGFAFWGVSATLKKMVGMFALALWDREMRTLFLARDRLGEKPLYYGRVGKDFVFSSEIKGLRAHPSWKRDVDRDALALLLRFNYVPAPYSIQRGVGKLPPGCLLAFNRGWNEPRIETYWSGKEIVETGLETTRLKLTDDEAVDELDSLLRRSVSGQMLSDVPLGAFLSGGIDSSAIVAQMQSVSRHPVRTFTIGFEQADFNEAEHAKAVAAHLGTDHEELYVTSREALDVIPRLPALYDEPFADSSQIPTFLVSQLARRHVTVALSGDGGDELFGGYNRYFVAPEIWRKVSRFPLPLRRSIGAMASLLPAQRVGQFFADHGRFMPRSLRFGNVADKLQKVAAIFGAEEADEVYRQLACQWKPPERVVLGAGESRSLLEDKAKWARAGNFAERMMFLDLVSYLPDDILVKVDRAAMGVSLETRVPFLDHRIVEFAWRLPLRMKIRDGQGKWLLRQVLDRYVPRKLIERPKMGFAVPIDNWLRGPLREWAESLLAVDRLSREGYFDPRPIRRKWEEHLSGRHNWQHHLWSVLMFQAWLEKPG